MLDPEFLLGGDGRERLIARFGAGVVPWCDALPGLAERCCLRWHLQLDTALSGNTSRVFLGSRRGGRGVVLKLTPDPSIAAQEALALRAWATPHAVSLLAADPAAGALLLEKIEPGTKLSDQPGLPPVREIAELLTGLRDADSDASRQLPALAPGVESMF
ncbi:MAG: aminoglycoside phosphotransferase, partial [Actinobacteria bacterium]|nr:aminoglycoside phosphotransferase [Actinomycetota bacterium]